MVKTILIFVAIVGCSFQSYSQNTINKGLGDIKSDSLKALVSIFETKTCPFEFSRAGSENVIDTILLKSILHKELSNIGVGIEDYYSQYVFYAENYIGLIITYHYSPGAFGIENFFIELVTVTYSGDIISESDLGCFCDDTNMGSNDYYSSEITVKVDSSEIIIDEKNTHATLIEEEGIDSFEDVSNKIYKLTLGEDGIVGGN